MSKFAGLGMGPALGIGAAAVAALTGVVVLTGRQDAPPSELAAPMSESVPQTEAAAVEASAADAPETDVALVPEAPADPQEPVLPEPPSIDTFRLDADGSMLVAGQAEPGWQTMIMVDGEALAEALPDGQGKFVSFLSLEQSAAPRILSLAMRRADQPEIVSLDEIIIAPLLAVEAPPETELAATSQPAPAGATTEEPDTSPDVAVASETALPETQLPGPASEAATGRVSEAQEPAAATTQQQAVLRATQEGIEVIQPAAAQEAAPEVMSTVALDAITYSETGEVALAGRGQGEGFVRVYLDNRPIITTEIGLDGHWRTELPQVDTGVYTLRVDEVDTGGQVTSRVETPFQREEKAVVSESLVSGDDPQATAVAVVTVQPGSTLWAISRERYGEGLLYVRVFEANRDRIRDPDLIYPGQIFTLPE